MYQHVRLHGVKIFLHSKRNYHQSKQIIHSIEVNFYLLFSKQMANIQNFKELQKLNTKEIKLLINKWANELLNSFQKKGQKWLINILKSVSHHQPSGKCKGKLLQYFILLCSEWLIGKRLTYDENESLKSLPVTFCYTIGKSISQPSSQKLLSACYGDQDRDTSGQGTENKRLQNSSL